jgi:ADP-heptose:LPS heptosyltransferase
MRVEARHAGIMQRLEVPYITTNERTDMPGIILDWVLERDHTDPDLGKLHRTEIYFKALGIPMPELDWSMDPRRFPDVPVTGKYVVMVGQGSNSRKKLPDMTVDKILRKLVDNGIKVCYNGEPELDIAGVEFLRRRLSVPELFSLIFHSQALITVDSGPLWIAHFASSPIVAILGPSHFKQRTVLHPLYPEGVYNIQMNDWLGCRSCTENGIGCREEYRCLNMNGDRLADEVLLGTKKYMSEV